MAYLDEAFDHSAVPEDDRSFDLIPNGDYEAQIIGSEVKPTKDGNGKRLNLTIEITSGPFANRKVWDGINFINPSATAQTIGQQRLKAYCEAVGHAGHLSDTDDLHFKPIRVKIGVGRTSDQYPDPRNEIKAVKPYSAGAPPAGKPAISTAPRPAAPAPSRAAPPSKPAGSRPWSKGGAAATA